MFSWLLLDLRGLILMRLAGRRLKHWIIVDSVGLCGDWCRGLLSERLLCDWLLLWGLWLSRLNNFGPLFVSTWLLLSLRALAEHLKKIVWDWNGVDSLLVDILDLFLDPWVVLREFIDGAGDDIELLGAFAFYHGVPHLRHAPAIWLKQISWRVKNRSFLVVIGFSGIVSLGHARERLLLHHFSLLIPLIVRGFAR